ncbi:MAG: response regulator transcription factor [Verrucomicrobiaceae bacterium]|nr:MAG: response regulator transcription factor [Verrucomicrobiaceae bacterium]
MTIARTMGCALRVAGTKSESVVRGRTGDLDASEVGSGTPAKQHSLAYGSCVVSQFKSIVPGSGAIEAADAHLERLMLLLAQALRFSDERVEILESALSDIEVILEQARAPQPSVHEDQRPFIASGPGSIPPRAHVEDEIAAPPKQDFESLSPREKQIVEHLTRGEANRVIASKLNLAEATVKVHVKMILRKLGLKYRTQAALCALQEGWLKPGTAD